MKYFTLFTALLICGFISAQSLPFSFEDDITTEDFVDFDGGVATVIANPDMGAGNTSNTVAQIIRNGGEIWGGSKIVLDANLDFSSESAISLKVWTSAPVGTNVKFKLEGNEATERDTQTTVSGEWETLTWDFSGEPSNFNQVVFMFGYGAAGDGSDQSTFYFDDVEQFSQGGQLDLPVTFDEENVNYTLIPFEGNSASVVVDPTDNSNMVMASTKTPDASPSAGTTIGTNAGFVSNIPLTLTDSRMSVKVWSPAAGVPVRLKVEDSNDPTHTCETEVNTTVGGEWEVLVFDFINQAPGTELLEVGLNQGWVYNKASIFFNFATGFTMNEPTYYCDDIMFGEGEIIDNISESDEISVVVFPNPTADSWSFTNLDKEVYLIEIMDIEGKHIASITPINGKVIFDASLLSNGIYFAQLKTENKIRTVKLTKE